jgi:hypothetical protein
VLLDLLQEVVRCEDRCDIGVLGVCLISGVDVIELLSADRSPLLKCDEAIFEDLLGVDLDKTTITIISDTTTVVTLGDQVLDCLPWDLALLVVKVGYLSDSAHVVGNRVLANLVITIVERVSDVPTEVWNHARPKTAFLNSRSA